MEIFAGGSNRSTDSEHQSKKMGVVRSRFEKNAIRVCGDWSEQLSSKGKIYFYNCITEVSQWQKPSEWNLPDLEHDELIKVLSQRDNLDVSVVKRPRLMCNAPASVRKDDDVARISPKRLKAYDHTESEKRYVVDDRVCPERNVCSYVPKNRPPLRQRSYRESPKIECNGSSHYTSQYSNTSNVYGKRNPSIPMHRPVPADDMEISPNSSPLSGGSSPLGYSNSHSPRRVKCRTGAVPRVLRRAACSDAKIPSHDNTAKSGNSHTLRQLLDAIRDSIGGLLDQSPCSSSNQKIKPSGSTNGLHYKQITDSNDKGCSSTLNSSGHTNRNVDQTVKSESIHSGRIPPNKFHNDSYVHSPGNSVAQPQLSTAPSSDRLNVTDKSMSGLVSTLSTLVNLIGSRNSNLSSAGDGSSIHTPTQTSSYRQSFTRPHLQQSMQHRFGSQQAVSSPLTPSPATPSATTGASSGGGSSGSTLANSISSAGTFNSVQQQDDSMSGPDRLGTTKFRTSASISSHGLNSPCNVQRPISPSRPAGLEVRDGLRLLPHTKDPIPTDELPQERQKPTVEANTAMDHSPSEKEFRARIPKQRNISAGSASPAVSSTSRVNTGLPRQNSPTTSQLTTHKSLSVTGPPRDSAPSSDKRCEMPRSPDKLYPLLDTAETQIFIEPSLNLQYRDIAAERLEGEAQTEAKRFDRLHSVLYGELSAESKTLRALVRISEAKLALHKEKQSSLQDLMDTIECHRQLSNPTIPDDVI